MSSEKLQEAASFCKSVAVTSYIKGWDAADCGESFDKSQNFSWKQGHKARVKHDLPLFDERN